MGILFFNLPVRLGILYVLTRIASSSTHNIYFKVKSEKMPKISLNICLLDMSGIS